MSYIDKKATSMMINFIFLLYSMSYIDKKATPMMINLILLPIELCPPPLFLEPLFEPLAKYMTYPLKPKMIEFYLFWSSLRMMISIMGVVCLDLGFSLRQLVVGREVLICM